MPSLKKQALVKYANSIQPESIKLKRDRGVTTITAMLINGDPVTLYTNKAWIDLKIPVEAIIASPQVSSAPLVLTGTTIIERDPEPVELLSNSDDYKQYFSTSYRFPFADSSKRYYFDKLGNIYSGLTGAISSHPLFDKSYLSKIAHQKALEDGINVYTEWTIAADYGTLLHTFISMHEINEDEFKFSFSQSKAWMDYLREYCIKLGYTHLIPKWSNMIQNDLAAWFTFKKERNVKVLLSEVCVKDGSIGIMTPIDIVCELDWERKRQIATINLKSGKSIAYEDIKFQSYVETVMFNMAIPDEPKKATVSLLWRPKDRFKSPCEYEISKNLIDSFERKDMEMLGYIVEKKRLNKPQGVILNITGDENNFVIHKLSPEEYVKLFVMSKS